MAKLVEGLWDCPYCGQKGIGGLTKQCPGCGHPQDEGTRFYLAGQKRQLSQDEADKVGTKADWICPYCNSYNNAALTVCRNCGADRESSESDYFTQKAPQKQETPESFTKPPVKKKSRLGLIAAVIAVIVAISLIGSFLGRPKNLSGEVIDKHWTIETSIEHLITCQESDWSLPSNATLLSQSEEIKSYRQVLDHYESVPYEVAEEVLDGYDVEITYEDNGNGTYTEVENSVPRYTTEYHTEYREEAVYRDEPVYATKYYYEIDRWKEKELILSEGGQEETPKEGEYTLGENERVAYCEESYTLTLSEDKKQNRTHQTELPRETWDGFSVGDQVTYTLDGSWVTELAKK